MPIKQPTETRQAALVAAALALAAERSPSEVTTAALAQAVGITQGAVFRHFESKEAIWVAVIDFAHRALLDRLRAAADAQPDPLLALRAVFMAHVGFVVEQPGVPRVIFQELQHPEDTPLKARVRELMQAYRALLAGLLERAKAERQLAPGKSVRFARSSIQDPDTGTIARIATWGDWVSPITVPCSCRAALCEIRLLKVGLSTALPNPDTVADRASPHSVFDPAMIANPTTSDAKPDRTSPRSPNRLTSRPISPPCKIRPRKPL